MLLLDTEGADMWEDSQDSTTATHGHSLKMEEHVSHRNVGEAKVGKMQEHEHVLLYLLKDTVSPSDGTSNTH